MKGVLLAMYCKITSLFLCVTDMARAIKFYEDFFEKKTNERDDIYGNNWVAEFIDSENNHIELTAPERYEGMLL